MNVDLADALGIGPGELRMISPTISERTRQLIGTMSRNHQVTSGGEVRWRSKELEQHGAYGVDFVENPAPDAVNDSVRVGRFRVAPSESKVQAELMSQRMDTDGKTHQYR